MKNQEIKNLEVFVASKENNKYIGSLYDSVNPMTAYTYELELNKSFINVFTIKKFKVINVLPNNLELLETSEIDNLICSSVIDHIHNTDTLNEAPIKHMSSKVNIHKNILMMELIQPTWNQYIGFVKNTDTNIEYKYNITMNPVIISRVDAVTINQLDTFKKDNTDLDTIQRHILDMLNNLHADNFKKHNKIDNLMYQGFKHKIPESILNINKPNMNTINCVIDGIITRFISSLDDKPCVFIGTHSINYIWEDVFIYDPAEGVSKVYDMDMINELTKHLPIDIPTINIKDNSFIKILNNTHIGKVLHNNETYYVIHTTNDTYVYLFKKNNLSLVSNVERLLNLKITTLFLRYKELSNIKKNAIKPKQNNNNKTLIEVYMSNPSFAKNIKLIQVLGKRLNWDSITYEELIELQKYPLVVKILHDRIKAFYNKEMSKNINPNVYEKDGLVIDQLKHMSGNWYKGVVKTYNDIQICKFSIYTGSLTPSIHFDNVLNNVKISDRLKDDMRSLILDSMPI